MQNAVALCAHWSKAYDAARAAEAELTSAPPERQAALGEILSASLDAAIEIEEELARDATPGVEAAVGKLRVALCHAKRDGEIDLNWRLVAAALASLSGGMGFGAVGLAGVSASLI